MLIRRIICMVVAVLGAAAAHAAEPQAVGIRELIEKGLSRNNQVRTAEFQAAAAGKAAQSAGLHYLPTLNFEESWTRSNLPVNTFMMKLNQGRFTNQNFAISNPNNPSPVSDFRTALTLEQPILAPVSWAARDMAEQGAAQQAALSEHTRSQVAFQVFRAYLEVQKAKAYLAAADKALDEARESSRQATVRTAAGLGLKSDELRAATHQAAMEQQRLAAQNNVTLARMQLAIAAGGEPGEQVDAVEPVRLQEPRQGVEAFVTVAQQERREIRAYERGRDQAEAAVRQARAGYLPSIGAIASWQMNDHTAPLAKEHDAWMAGVSLRWNLFDGLRTRHGDARAVAERSAAHEQLIQIRKDVGYQVHEAWLRHQEAVKRHTVAVLAAGSAEETVRLVSKRFDNALASMVELLDAQTALNRARADLVESETGVVLAIGRIYQSAGILLKEIQ